jgi:outer membrane protein assembly complex protein YaeT
MVKFFRSRKPAWWVRAGILAFCCLLVGFLVLVSTEPARRWALAQLTAKLAEEGIGLKAASLDIRLLSLRATLRDASFYAPGKENLPFARAESIDVWLLWHFGFEQPSIASITIEQPQVNVRFDRQGGSNLPVLRERTSSSKPLSIGRINVTRGAVLYEDQLRGIAASLPQIDIEITEPAESQYKVAGKTTQPGYVDYQGRRLAVGELTTALNYAPERLDIQALRLRTEALEVEGSGRVDNFADPKLQLKVRAHGDDANLVASLAGMPNRVKGGFEVDLSIDGPAKAPAVQGEAGFTAFSFDTYGPVDGKANFALAENFTRLDLQKLNARLASASVEGSGDLALTANQKPSRLDLKFGGLTTAQIAKLTGSDVPIASIASGSINASFSMPFDARKASGKASVHLDAVRGRVPVAGDLTASAQGGVTTLAIKSLQTFNATAQGTVTVAANNTLGGQLDILIADASRTLKDLQTAGYISGITDDTVRGSLSAEVKLSGPVRDPHAEIHATSNSLNIASTVAGSLVVDTTVSKTRVDLRQLRYESSPDFLLTASGQMLDTRLDFKGEVRHASVKALAQAAGSKSDSIPDGSLHSQFQIAGTSKDPIVNATVDSDNLMLLKQPLGSLRAAIEYAGDTVSVKQLSLARNGGSIRGSGTWNVKARSLSNADATIQNYKIDLLQLADGSAPKATLNGSVRSQGPAGAITSTVEVTASDIAFRDIKAQQAAFRAVLTGDRVDANLLVPAWRIASTLRGSLANQMPAEFTVDLDNSPIEAVSPDYSGTVTANLRGTVELANAAKTVKGTADLKKALVRARKFGRASGEFHVDQPAQARFDGRIVDLTPLAITSDNSSITVSGRIPIEDTDRSGLVRVQADLDLERLSRTFGYPEEGLVRGRIKTDAVLSGGGREWNPEGAVELSQGEVMHPKLPSSVQQANVALDLKNQEIQVRSGTANWMGGIVTLGGRFPFGLLLDSSKPPASPFDLSAAFANLKLEALADGDTARTLGGEASFQVRVRGSSLKPEEWEGSLQASALKINVAQTVFEQRSPLTVTLRNSLATVEPFVIAGPQSSMKLSGSLSLLRPNPLALRIEGDVNAALLQLVSSELRAEGETHWNIAISGTLEQPRLGGRIDLAGVQWEIPAAQAVLEDLKGAIEFTGRNVTVAKMEGQLNGGPLHASGTALLNGRNLDQVNFKIKSQGTAWNIPEGLETAADIDLSVTGGSLAYNVEGTVRILDGSYRESLAIERGLFRTLSADSTLPANLPGQQTTPINLNIRVETVDPILVSNELLNGEITANLRVTGTPQRLGLIGRADINEGANFYIGGRNYLIDRGAVTFTNQSKIEPTLDVRGHTRAGGYDITLEARGTVGEKLDTTFTSDPQLPQPDILSLLVSGRKLSDTRGQETQIAQDQALSYLSGNIGATLSQQANRALGFNFVRIDPGLIADEAEPTARLTLGQDITDRLGLVYSVNLKNSSDQIYIGRYDITKRFQTRVVRQSDNSLRFQFQHDIEFGGTPPPEAKKGKKSTQKIGEVKITSDPPDAEPRLRSKLDLKTGKTFDFFAFRKGIERMKKDLVKRGFPEARIRSTRDSKPGIVDVAVNVVVGPKVEFRYEGNGIDQKEVEKAWAQSSFDSLRIRQATDGLKKSYAKDGFYSAQIDVNVRNREPRLKTVTVDADRGRKYKDVRVVLPGAALREEIAKEVVPDKDARVEAAVHPERLAPRVEDAYRRRGYLEAKARPATRRREDSDTLTLAVRVVEGKQSHVGEVRYEGNKDVTQARLAEASGLKTGQPYEPVKIEEARDTILKTLRDSGYGESTVTVAADNNGGLDQVVNVKYTIVEGPKRILNNIAIEGNQHVSDSLVKSQIAIKTGDIITDQKLNEARRNLYSTGAFALADVELKKEEPGTLVARLREVRPLELRYGVLYDTERGAGGIFDITSRNILGSARTAGIRGRYDSRLQEARVYFEQPSLRRLPVRLVTTGFRRRELNTTFITDRTGGSAYLEYRWRRPYLFNFGYRFEQTHTFEREPDPVFPFDIRLRIAPLTAGFSRDTRDDLIDATRGSFTSHITEWAPARLGSELRYAKYFGQYFYYRPLSKPVLVPWAGGTRSRIVYAGGVRFGIAAGMGGQDLVPSERFFAGGSTTVRGFVQDRLGPISGSSPTGGESMFVVNNEIRFPLYKFFDGVGFVDTGNVFERWRDFRISDLRYTGGAGLRVRSPYFLFRLDYGFILDRRTGEPSGRLFFGIGQTF